jgi:hypothetical protein
MSKHTPGPWAVEVTEDSNFILQGEDSDQIAVCDRAFGDANARLIAATPEMLIALETVMREFAPFGTEGLTPKQSLAIGRVMNAIAKATGGDA